MRRWIVAGVAVPLLLLVPLGCASESGEETKRSSTQEEDARGTDRPRESEPVSPAAEAGGLCTYLDYDQVFATVGRRFDVAAASGAEGQPQACVLRRAKAEFPILTFTQQPVTMSPDDFRADFLPEGASHVDGLGEAAYSAVQGPDGGSGPRPEVGWLASGAIYTIVLTAEPTTNPDHGPQLTSELTNLAHQVPM